MMKNAKKKANKKSNKRMKIPVDTIRKLWFLAHGRCEFSGCNKSLLQDNLTKQMCNVANVAHIVADSPDGPRGDIKRSKLLANDINNLMLMCRDHHKLIDDSNNFAIYTESFLLKMKKKHEDRIEKVTAISEDKKIHAVIYQSKIKGMDVQIDQKNVIESLFPDFYPCEDHPIVMEWSGLRKTGTQYWKDEIDNLESICKELVLNPLSRWDDKKIALFAMAPMPLLVKLGAILNNKQTIVVYQKHRTPDTWKWLSENPNVDYVINVPEDNSKSPVLVFSLSDSIINRVKQEVGDDASIWELTIDNPDQDFLRDKSQLDVFSRKVEHLLNEIKNVTGKDSLDVYMAMPVACAVELGRLWQPDAHMKMRLYDLNGSKDEYAFTIG